MKISTLSLLRQNQDFARSTAAPILYRRSPAASQELLSRYPLEKIAGTGDNLSKAIHVMEWLSHGIQHDGAYGNGDRQEALTLLSTYYGKEKGVNCLALSIILSECCLALFIPARVVYMMPYETDDTDNHVVTEIYWNTQKRWVMLDPTYCCFTSDQAGMPLSLLKIRSCLCNGRDIRFSESICYNGERSLDLEDIRQYYIKNLFFLRCRSIQEFGSHLHYGDVVEIAPNGFDVHSRMVENLRYRIAAFGSFPILEEWLAHELQLQNRFLSPVRFYQNGTIA